MNLQDIHFKNSYKTPRDDILNDFLIPSLKHAVEYNRSVGFFSSSALLALSVGIVNLLKNDGTMKVICSHKLSDQDILAIKRGYENRNEDFEHYCSELLKKDFTLPKNEFEKERFNILSHLISLGKLDIKIAFPVYGNEISMFHDKLGIIIDKNRNFVAFSGSMNESLNAMQNNYENIDVFTSFGPDYDRALEKKMDFEYLWSNNDEGAIVIDFPDDLKQEIHKFQKENVDYEIDRKQFCCKKDQNLPALPLNIVLRDYQEDAINSWENHNFIGIYDMATGTGKTITALASIIRLLEKVKYKLAIIICCPYQHLVDQWCEDLEKFKFEYIVGYSGSPQKKWKKDLEKSILEYSNGVKDILCFITTNSSFRTPKLQGMISNIRGEILLVVDEAHNFGSPSLLKLLDNRFNYRLALSATLERKNDIYGTEGLFNFFGEKCIIYSLEQAIRDHKLTNYYYYPIPVYLTSDELERYNELSEKISKLLKYNIDGSVELKKGAEILLIKRARLVAGAENKIAKLKKIIAPFKNDDHMLVYCGATTVVDQDFKEGKVLESEERQVTVVSKMMNEELGIFSSRFTSQETTEERQFLKEEFDKGDNIQALVAIRCLDEGVNIPSIKTAFILASSTNPKEYIQRRGRVLRLYPGKNFATIYDFVTLPRPLDEITLMDDLVHDKSLIKRELLRVNDFAKLALNSRDSDKLISDIISVYGDLEREFIL